jgi:phage repressor protein C with HTH and peptisase S24 domain
MYPTLKNRDYLLIDRSMSDVKALGSGIYMISEDNTLKIRRLIYNSYDKSIKVVSDNVNEVGGIKEYPNYEINADKYTDNFKIVGRSIWNGRQF